MEMKLRKLWPLIGALCLGLMSSASAHNNYQSGTSSNIDSSLQQDTYQRGTFREITPPAGPRVAHGADVYVTADFIWWKASEGALPFFITGLNESAIPDEKDESIFTSPTRGKILAMGESWAPGFKVCVGLNLGHDGWDIQTQYTWLHTSHSDSHKEKSGVILDPPQIHAHSDKLRYDSIDVTSRKNLHFNVMDLNLGRNFYLSQFFTTRPYIGIKGTWQKHTWDVVSSLNNLKLKTGDDKEVAVTGPLTSSKHYDVWGLGIRNGLNAAWHLSKSFSLYGDVALSSLWTNCYKSTQHAKLEDKEKKKHRTLVDIANEAAQSSKPIIELGGGIRWDKWFYDDTYHFAMQLGWEQQNWMDWSQFQDLRSGFSNGNHFSTKGGILKFCFSF